MLGAKAPIDPCHNSQVQAEHEAVVANSGVSSIPVVYSCGESKAMFGSATQPLTSVAASAPPVTPVGPLWDVVTPTLRPFDVNACDALVKPETRASLVPTTTSTSKMTPS